MYKKYTRKYKPSLKKAGRRVKGLRVTWRNQTGRRLTLKRGGKKL